MNKDIDYIPLKNLPISGLTAFCYKPHKEGDKTAANNVLIAAIDNLEEVSLIGRSKTGEYYFASSMARPGQIVYDLNEFIDLLETYESE